MSDEQNEMRWKFIHGFNAVAEEIEAWADRKGWNSDDPKTWDKGVKEFLGLKAMESLQAAYDVSKLGLMMTEVGEAIEGRRHGDPPSDKIPEFTSQEEELADCIVRIMHYAAHEKLRVAEALITKLQYNEDRPYKHGKQV
jgi:NTP pyrophosphatase (non-canonical NTP hydrolase)